MVAYTATLGRYLVNGEARRIWAARLAPYVPRVSFGSATPSCEAVHLPAPPRCNLTAAVLLLQLQNLFSLLFKAKYKTERSEKK